MGFDTSPEKKDELKGKQFELASKLDNLLLESNVSTVEGAVRYMAANTRQTLLQALEMAEKNSTGVTNIEKIL